MLQIISTMHGWGQMKLIKTKNVVLEILKYKHDDLKLANTNTVFKIVRQFV